MAYVPETIRLRSTSPTWTLCAPFPCWDVAAHTTTTTRSPSSGFSRGVPPYASTTYITLDHFFRCSLILRCSYIFLLGLLFLSGDFWLETADSYGGQAPENDTARASLAPACEKASHGCPDFAPQLSFGTSRPSWRSASSCCSLSWASLCIDAGHSCYSVSAGQHTEQYVWQRILVVSWMPTMDPCLSCVLPPMRWALGQLLPWHGLSAGAQEGYATRQAQSFQSPAAQVAPRTRTRGSATADAATTSSSLQCQGPWRQEWEESQRLSLGPRKGSSRPSKGTSGACSACSSHAAGCGSQDAGDVAGLECLQGQSPCLCSRFAYGAGGDSHGLQGARDAQAGARPSHQVPEIGDIADTTRGLYAAVASLCGHSRQESRDADCGERQGSAKFFSDRDYLAGGDRRGDCCSVAACGRRQAAHRGLGGGRGCGGGSVDRQPGSQAARGSARRAHAAGSQGGHDWSTQARWLQDAPPQGLGPGGRKAAGGPAPRGRQGRGYATGAVAISYCIAQACLARCNQAGFSINPLSGQGLNGLCGGACHPLSLAHSVCGQHDFVSTWLARADAIFLEFEVNVADLQFQMGFADPLDWTSTKCHESAWLVAADPGQHDDIVDASPHGQFRCVESQCLSSCSADEAVSVRPDTVSASTRNVHSICLYSEGPAVAVAAFEFSKASCARRCLRTVPFGRLCQATVRERVNKKVRFDFTVSFWFPAHYQLCLSTASQAKAHLACARSPEGCIPGSSAVCPAMPGPPIFSLPRSKAKGKATPTFAPTAASSACSPFALTPSNATVVSEVVGEGVAVLEHPLLEGEPPNRFTSFDELQGTRVLVGSADWPAFRYVAMAVETSLLPGVPTGRIMLSELASFPSPQVAITQDRGPDLRRAIVVDAGLIEGVETLDVFPGVTPVGVIRGLRSVLHPRVAEEQLASGQLLCLINRAPVDHRVAIPGDADVMQFVGLRLPVPAHPAEADQLPACVEPKAATSIARYQGPRPQTPAIPVTAVRPPPPPIPRGGASQMLVDRYLPDFITTRPFTAFDAHYGHRTFYCHGRLSCRLLRLSGAVRATDGWTRRWKAFRFLSWSFRPPTYLQSTGHFLWIFAPVVVTCASSLPTGCVPLWSSSLVLRTYAACTGGCRHSSPKALLFSTLMATM